MKINFTLPVLTIFLFCSLLNEATAQYSCGTTSHMEKIYQRNPKMREAYQQREAIITQWLNAHPSWRSSSSTIYTIPVVVHVVYKNAAENLPDSQIISQIDVLNEDYARLNADTVNTPSAFNVAGPTDFRFCLAQRDPDDLPTTGIERRLTTVPVFSDTTDYVNYFATGGLDAWDQDKYLNIWVCALDSSIKGYGEFPDIIPSGTYGAVINYIYFGRGTNVLAPFNLGRVTTHEVGHCLGLNHIWGDDFGYCWGDDGVADTPNQSNATTGCSTFPTYDSCTSTGNGIMYMNYMDYTVDSCMNMFTLGQGGRMQLQMTVTHPGLMNSSGCEPIIIANGDIWLREVISPAAKSCDPLVTPIIRVRNYGNDTIHDLDINYAYDGGSFSTYHWTGSMGLFDSEIILLPSVTMPGAVHTLTIYTSNPNFSADPEPLNDSATVTFEIFGRGSALPVAEGFEGVTYPPTNWNIINPDGDKTWESTSLAAKSGVNSAFMNNSDYANAGAQDDLLTQNVDLSSVTNPVLTFDVAYTYYQYVSLISTDTLEVWVSTDCGFNFTQVFGKGGVDLSTAPHDSLPFYPDPSEWRNEIISLASFAADTQVMILFRNINGWGNNLFLDNINLTSATGLPETLPGNSIRLYPNPASGECTIDLGTIQNSAAEIQVYDNIGRMHASAFTHGSSKYPMDISTLGEGFYFIRITSEKICKVLPLVIRR